MFAICHICLSVATKPENHQRLMPHLTVEVEETILTVDVPEGSKALHGPVYTHGVVTHLPTHSHEYPVWVGTTYEHLKCTQLKFYYKN